MTQGEIKPRFHKGRAGSIKSTRWKVFTLSKDGMSFVEIGRIFVAGKKVARAMDEHQYIKGYCPWDIAEKMAQRKYPKVNPVIVEEITDEA